MRLTIVNLLIQSGNEGERKHSATILARKLFELNPPYAGPAMRPMLHIGTRMRGSKVKPPLRRRGHNGVPNSLVIPAKSRDHAAEFSSAEFLRVTRCS